MCALSAHSKTVGAAPEVPPRPRMQVSPTGSAIADAPPFDAFSSSAAVDAALVAQPDWSARSSASGDEQGRCCSASLVLLCPRSRASGVMPSRRALPKTRRIAASDLHGRGSAAGGEMLAFGFADQIVSGHLRIATSRSAISYRESHGGECQDPSKGLMTPVDVQHRHSVLVSKRIKSLVSPRTLIAFLLIRTARLAGARTPTPTVPRAVLPPGRSNSRRASNGCRTAR